MSQPRAAHTIFAPRGGFYLVLRLLCAQRRFEKIFMGIRPQLSMRIMNWLTPTSDFCQEPEKFLRYPAPIFRIPPCFYSIPPREVYTPLFKTYPPLLSAQYFLRALFSLSYCFWHAQRNKNFRGWVSVHSQNINV